MSQHRPTGRVLAGGREIACAAGLSPRQVFHHASAGRLPHYRIGRSMFAHEDLLMDWVEQQREQEKAAASLAGARR